MMGACYQTKKKLKEAIGRPLNYIETSMFGPEFKANGTVTVVGPDPYNNRKWFAAVTLRDGLIVKVS